MLGRPLCLELLHLGRVRLAHLLDNRLGLGRRALQRILARSKLRAQLLKWGCVSRHG